MALWYSWFILLKNVMFCLSTCDFKMLFVKYSWIFLCPSRGQFCWVWKCFVRTWKELISGRAIWKIPLVTEQILKVFKLHQLQKMFILETIMYFKVLCYVFQSIVSISKILFRLYHRWICCFLINCKFLHNFLNICI